MLSALCIEGTSLAQYGNKIGLDAAILSKIDPQGYSIVSEVYTGETDMHCRLLVKLVESIDPYETDVFVPVSIFREIIRYALLDIDVVEGD